MLAASVPTDDRYKYLRTYPPNPAAPSSPLANAPVTGFYSMQYGSTGLERTEDPVLNGSDNRLFGRRFFDLVSGRDPRGGNVVTTINPVMQQVAYDELTAKGYTGSVVAIEPSTGRILTMVSTPSYDPNSLASHDGTETTQAWEALNADPEKPLINRAVSQTYPPGSTFKVVVTAAALAAGTTPDTQLTAAPQITLPGTSTTLENYNGSTCGGAPTASLREAFARSCNTAFVELGIKTGADAVSDEASRVRHRWPDARRPVPRRRQHHRVDPRRRRTRPEQHRPARRGTHSAAERDDRGYRRQRWRADATATGVRTAGTGSLQPRDHQPGVRGPGDVAAGGGDPDRPDDRFREQHQRRQARSPASRSRPRRAPPSTAPTLGTPRPTPGTSGSHPPRTRPSPSRSSSRTAAIAHWPQPAARWLHRSAVPSSQPDYKGAELWH